MFGSLIQPSPKSETIENFLINALDQPVAYVSAAVIAAEIFDLVFSPLRAPFLGLAVGRFVSTIGMDGVNYFFPKFGETLREKVSHFNQNHPMLKVTLFIVSLAMSLINIYAAAITAAMVGVLNSVLFDVKLHSRIKEEMESGLLATFPSNTTPFEYL